MKWPTEGYSRSNLPLGVSESDPYFRGPDYEKGGKFTAVVETPAGTSYYTVEWDYYAYPYRDLGEVCYDATLEITAKAEAVADPELPALIELNPEHQNYSPYEPVDAVFDELEEFIVNTISSDFRLGELRQDGTIEWVVSIGQY